MQSSKGGLVFEPFVLMDIFWANLSFLDDFVILISNLAVVGSLFPEFVKLNFFYVWNIQGRKLPRVDLLLWSV
jgi:hypothetical protein